MEFGLFLKSPGEIFTNKDEWAKNTIGESIQHYHSDIKLQDFDLALISVTDSRGNVDGMDFNFGPNAIRNEFYKLNNHASNLNILDLGNIPAGDTVKDTYYAISQVVTVCVKKEVLPIVLGGSQDLTYAIYKAFEGLEQSVNMASVDSGIDVGVIEDQVTDQNYMNHIIMHQPNYLFNYSVLGYQSYYCDDELINLISKLNFDAYRLGEIRNDIEEVEPVLRDADILSFDLSALKASDAPGTALCSPNGLDGEDACRVSRYAGISDKLSVFSVFGYSVEDDQRARTAKLVAQMLWYFVEGYKGRMNDYPVASKTSYTKYHVRLEEEQMDLSFYKSPKSGRWWIDVPYPEDYNHKHARHLMMPCSYEDYIKACDGTLPERWWKAYQKLI